MVKVIYKIDVPFGAGEIEVYGESDMGWYEWRVVQDGKVLRDTKDQGYGSPGIALRDALIAVTE